MAKCTTTGLCLPRSLYPRYHRTSNSQRSIRIYENISKRNKQFLKTVPLSIQTHRDPDQIRIIRISWNINKAEYLRNRQAEWQAYTHFKLEAQFLLLLYTSLTEKVGQIFKRLHSNKQNNPQNFCKRFVKKYIKFINITIKKHLLYFCKNENIRILIKMFTFDFDRDIKQLPNSITLLWDSTWIRPKPSYSSLYHVPCLWLSFAMHLYVRSTDMRNEIARKPPCVPRVVFTEPHFLYVLHEEQLSSAQGSPSSNKFSRSTTHFNLFHWCGYEFITHGISCWSANLKINYPRVTHNKKIQFNINFKCVYISSVYLQT